MALYQFLNWGFMNEYLGWTWPANRLDRTIILKDTDSRFVKVNAEMPGKKYFTVALAMKDPDYYFHAILPGYSQSPPGNRTRLSRYSEAESFPNPLFDSTTRGSTSNEPDYEPSHPPTPDATPCSGVGSPIDPVSTECDYSFDCPTGEHCVHFDDFVPNTSGFCFKVREPKSYS